MLLAIDLPYLGFSPTLKGNEDGTHYDWIIKSNTPEINLKDKVNSILNLITTPHYPRISGCQFTKGDLRKLANEKTMHDSALNIIIKWIECVKTSTSPFIAVLSNNNSEMIRSSYNLYNNYKQDPSNNEASKEEVKLREVNNIHRFLKFDDNTLQNSECLFIVNNISNIHWNLVCLCNLRTISIKNNFIDMRNNDGIDSFSKLQFSDQPFNLYAPPCIIVFDSLNTEYVLNPKTLELIQGLRLWLSHDQEMNPSKIQFCEMNLPIYQVRCPQQTDLVSCGYFVFRNIIGLLNKANDIFPIKIEDLLRNCTSKAKYIEY